MPRRPSCLLGLGHWIFFRRVSPSVKPTRFSPAPRLEGFHLGGNTIRGLADAFEGLFIDFCGRILYSLNQYLGMTSVVLCSAAACFCLFDSAGRRTDTTLSNCKKEMSRRRRQQQRSKTKEVHDSSHQL